MKARYYEYSIQYKHRKYRILTPQSLPDEMYLCCNYYKNSDSDYIDGDRYTFQSLRNAAVTLALMEIRMHLTEELWAAGYLNR